MKTNRTSPKTDIPAAACGREEAGLCRQKCEAAACSVENEINTIIKTAMDGFWIMDSDGRFLDVNEAYCSMVGFSRTELLAMRIVDIEASESPEETALHMQKVMQTGSDRFETRHRCRDGRLIDAEVSTNFMAGPPARFFVFLRDISERKQAEARQSRLIQELQIMNRELAEFAHIVSHDLKAPLRAINSLAGWLADDYADKIDAAGREKFQLLMKMVRGMHNIIEGILQYSKLGGERDEITAIDLNELVPQIISLLAPPEHISVLIDGPLPTLVCQRTRIGQIFQNLLSNALQAIDKPEGKIRIACRLEGGVYLFSIADNGRGIEKRYFEKIFQIFQVISENREYGSSGIGLALVKKNVELYGGRVWVESVPGEGSSFFFTLPEVCRS